MLTNTYDRKQLYIWQGCKNKLPFLWIDSQLNLHVDKPSHLGMNSWN